jgi:hypothetical protein
MPEYFGFQRVPARVRIVTTPADGAIFVWRLADISQSEGDRSALIKDAKEKAEAAGNHSPTLVLLVSASDLKASDANWFASKGAIILEDTSENQAMLDTLKEEFNSARRGSNKPEPSFSLKEERWVLDEQGQLVLADSTDEEPRTEMNSTLGAGSDQIYQAVLDGLNSRSDQRR